MKLCRDLYGGETFIISVRAHALPSRMLFTLSHGRHSLQMLPIPRPPPPGGCVGPTFPIPTTWRYL